MNKLTREVQVIMSYAIYFITKFVPKKKELRE